MSNYFSPSVTVSAAENSTAVDVAGLKAGTITATVECSASPAWSGTWVIDISHDGGTTWAPGPTSAGSVTSTSTGSKTYIFDGCTKQMRLRASSYSAGSATMTVAGERA